MNEKEIRDQFKLRLAGIEDGTYTCSISCDKSFFDIANISNVSDGNLDLQITMTKTEKLVDLVCHFEGIVTAPCDRCLLPVQLPIHTEERLIVKLVPWVEENENEEDDIWILDENTYELDIFQFVYESIFLALPIQVLHENDENGLSTCDPTVLKKLEELSPKIEPTEKEIDPRWDALKNLKLD